MGEGGSHGGAGGTTVGAVHGEGGETWPLDIVLCPLHESGCGVSEASGEVKMGVSYSIYELKNYSKVSTTYIRGGEHEAMTGKAGEPCTVQKQDYG